MRELLDAIYQGRTLVFGHRGARAYAPMNTLPSFKLAADMAADGIELDVHLSRDGEVVILHDFSVDHTTDGKGLIRDMTLAELKALDAGNWFGAQFTGTRIPTLDEVFAAVGYRLCVNIEIKAHSWRSTGIEQAVAARIAYFNLGRRVLVSSFNPLVLRRFRRIMPQVPIGYLHMPGIGVLTAAPMIGLSHEARHPQETLVDGAYMKWARRKGYRVNVWIVNDPTRAAALRRLGVDMLITDAPDIIRAVIEE